jgi:hypothetical protein
VSGDEILLSEEAARYVRNHRRELIEHFASPSYYQPDTRPITLFMAASPGAGKTEISKNLVDSFRSKPVRIDADEIREWIPDHHGVDANVYQKAATDGVNKLYDHVRRKRLNTIIDGTFAYQDPLASWNFTKEREKLESRNVLKDYHKRTIDLKLNISNIESYLPKRYTREEFGGLAIMTRLFSTIFSRQPKPNSDFSIFFAEAKAAEKKRLIRHVVEQANEDQRELVRRAEQLPSAR